MKNFLQKGDALSLTAPYAVTSGQGAKVGNIFGIAQGDIASGAVGDFRLEGIFSVTKLSTDVVAVGDLLYWDDTNKRLTTTATANTKVGVATAAAAASTTTVNVRLNAAF